MCIFGDGHVKSADFSGPLTSRNHSFCSSLGVLFGLDEVKFYRAVALLSFVCF